MGLLECVQKKRVAPTSDNSWGPERPPPPLSTDKVSWDQLCVTQWPNQSVDIASIDSPQKSLLLFDDLLPLFFPFFLLHSLHYELYTNLHAHIYVPGKSFILYFYVITTHSLLVCLFVFLFVCFQFCCYLKKPYTASQAGASHTSTHPPTQIPTPTHTWQEAFIDPKPHTIRQHKTILSSPSFFLGGWLLKHKGSCIFHIYHDILSGPWIMQTLFKDELWGVWGISVGEIQLKTR